MTRRFGSEPLDSARVAAYRENRCGGIFYARKREQGQRAFVKKTGMIFAFRFGEAWFGKGRFREVQRLFRSHGGLRCARSVRYGLIKGKSPIGRFLNAVFPGVDGKKKVVFLKK